MEYIERTSTGGFKYTNFRKEAVLGLVRSDTGDGGWSLHSLQAHYRPDEYLLKGTAQRVELTFRGRWYEAWDRPDFQDARAALAIEFAQGVALSTNVGDYTEDFGIQADIVTESQKSGHIR